MIEEEENLVFGAVPMSHLSLCSSIGDEGKWEGSS